MLKRAVDKYPGIDGFDIFIEIVLIAMILLPPLAMGAVVPWARSVLCLAAFALMTAWLIQGARRGELRVVRSYIWLAILALFALALCQLVPLAPSVIKGISPATWQAYATALTAYPASGEVRGLSLSSYATKGELVRIAILVVVFFITANVVRTRRQVIALIVALTAIGAFEALYGFAEHFSGHKHIFWLPRQYHLTAVTSTFHNKNHFAGLLEMIVPVSLGLLVANGHSGGKGGGNRPLTGKGLRGLLSGLSSPTVGRQVILAALATVMIIAIFFSLSRAGIACVAISLAGFFFFLWAGKVSRRYLVAMLIMVAVVLIVSAAIGIGPVVARVEEAAGGHSTSWTDRMDLAKSATGLIRDYPLVGTGLGTFGVVFPAYQSARFGDQWADYLHNDWLQTFCETGFVGGSILVIAAIMLVATLLRSATNQKNKFCRWIAVGGLLGVVAMLFHSFFDYNLSKITSNGIIFAIIAALPFAAENIRNAGEAFRRPRYWSVPINPAPVRVALLVVVLLAVGSGTYFSVSPAMADIHFNRYLAEPSAAGKADDYFFIPTQRSEAGDVDRGGSGHQSFVPDSNPLNRALALQPTNPRYLYYRSHNAINAADELVRREATDRAYMVARGDIATENPKEFNRIVAAIEGGIKSEMSAERMPFLTESKHFLLQAIDAAPTVARYHIALASVLAGLEGPNEQVLERAKLGMALAPNKPGVLYDVGRIYLAHAFTGKNIEEGDPIVERAFECFRKAIYADASYTNRIYPLIDSVGGGRRALMAATPRTVQAYERLYAVLWQAGDWEDALACVDEVETLIGRKATQSSSSRLIQSDGFAFEDDGLGPHLPGAVGYDHHRDPAVIKLLAARRRCDVLGITGRWKERSEVLTRYREILSEYQGASLEESGRLRDMGRTREALAICLENLEQNWGDPEILLEAAELTSLPGGTGGIPQRNDPLDHLYRLIINNEKLLPSHYERAMRILADCDLRTQPERAKAEFVKGAGALLSGCVDEGIEILKAQAEIGERSPGAWRQEHLVWHYLGRGYEEAGRREEAMEGYRRALEIVPTHRPSLIRLVLFGTDAVLRLAELTPEVPCNVDFGGKVSLLGYTIGSEATPAKIEGVSLERERWFITYYWQFKDHMQRDYRPAVHFCDNEWGIIFRNDHLVRAGGDPYPVDYPRCGEIIVEKRKLERDPRNAEYLRVGFWTPAPTKFVPKILYGDAGGGLTEIGLVQT